MKTISPGSPLAPTVVTGVALALYPGPPVIPMGEAEVAAVPAVPVPVVAAVPEVTAEADAAVLAVDAAAVEALLACCLRSRAIGGDKEGREGERTWGEMWAW